MTPEEIRKLDTAEIEEHVREEEEELDHLQFQHAIARLENPMLLREKRRLIARLKTIANERARETVDA